MLARYDKGSAPTSSSFTSSQLFETNMVWLHSWSSVEYTKLVLDNDGRKQFSCHWYLSTNHGCGT